MKGTIMRIARDRLLAAIDERTAEHEQAVLDWETAVDEAETIARAEYNAANDHKWREYRDNLTRALRRGETITREIVGRAPHPFEFRRGQWEAVKYSGGRSGYTWRGGYHSVGVAPNPFEVADLAAIRKVVEATTAVSFTPHELTGLGINAPLLRRVFGLETDTERGARLKRQNHVL